VPEVGHLGSATDIHTIADHRVSEIGEMWQSRGFAYIGVFDFDECSNFGVITNTRIPSYVRIWSYNCSFTEVDIPFDIGSRLEDHSFFEIDISFYGHILFYNCSFINNFTISSNDRIVGPQEIPWIPYRYPSTGSLDDTIESLLDIDMDEICDLEFSSGREREGSEYLEYLIIELVIADIGEIPDTHIGWFLDDSSRFSVVITGEYSEELRTIHLFAECCVSFLLYQFQDVSALIEVIARHYDEFSSDMSLECEDRSTST
jgi:hypothetical protein